MNGAFVFVSIVVVTAASVYLLIRNRLDYPVYSLVLLLIVVLMLSSVLTILHWPGADESTLVGFSGVLLGSLLLVIKSFRNSQHELLFYKLMAGAILLFQLVSGFFWPEYAHQVELMNYPMTAFAATVLINKQYDHEGERNMVILFTVQGVLAIIMDVLKLV